jgi:hypothetical protein
MVKKQNENGLVPILILVLVVVVAGAAGYFYLNMDKVEQPTLPVNTTKSSLTLELESPADGTLITDNQLLVKGKTAAGATVVFFTDADENSIEADASGNFEGKVGMVEGINTLTVTAYGENGEESTTTLDVVNDSEE